MRWLGSALVEVVIKVLGPGPFRLRMVKFKHRMIGSRGAFAAS